MSGKKNDILDPLKSLIDEGKRESVSKIVTILEEHRPKVKIDKEYQKSLKQTLLTQEKSQFTLSLRIPWFTVMTSIGAITTCFVAAFWLYNLWIGASPIKNTWTLKANPANMMYSEEKAEKFASDAAILENTTGWTVWVNNTSNAPISISPRAFKAEKSAIDKEVAEIQNEILDTDSLDVPSIIPSSPIMMKDAILPTPSPGVPNFPQNTVWSASMNPAMLKISPQMALSESIQALPKLVYPSVMNIYTKPTPWTNEEILKRSWSGLIIKESPTEKYSILENRAKTLAGWKKILSYSIVYHPRAKISRDTIESYSLVPTIEYTLEWWSIIISPLIRGYR